MDLLNLMQLGEFRPSVHGLGDFEPNITFVPSKPFLSDGSTYHADTIFAITPVSALAANASRSFHNVQSSSSTVIFYRHHLFVRLPWHQVNHKSRVYCEHARR